MKAKEAQQLAENHRNRVNKEWQKKDKIRQAAAKRATDSLWNKRSEALISTINGYIKKAALGGYSYTFEPTDINPNGDEIIYLSPNDRLIKERLMEHFRDEGFEVEDYQYGGMKITW